MRHTKAVPFYVKSSSSSEGIIERIVSVFGNVDRMGDRIKVGAFTNSIEEWKASGDPIPVVFSHDWSNLDAHLGVVEDLKELPPGDPLLPDEIKANGGLWVREKYDLHVPSAARAFELQQRRSIKESSFAYEVKGENFDREEGVNNLLELKLIEVGPCLKGANPATQLLAAKAIDPSVEPPAKTSLPVGEFTLRLAYEDGQLKAELVPSQTPAPKAAPEPAATQSPGISPQSARVLLELLDALSS